MSLPYRRFSGRISYGREGGGAGERGWETFSVTVHDRGRVVRAVCEMDDKKIIRDVNWTLDRDWNPVEGFVRVMLDGRLQGSCWFKIDGREVECEAVSDINGRVSQRYQSPAPIRYLGLHPLIGDAMIAGARGIDRPGVEDMINSITCSYSPDGETGMLAQPITIGVTYIGPETVTVKAGSFETQRYALNWRPEWPKADLWVHGDDRVVVKLHWSLLDVTEELVAYNPAE